MKKLFFVLVVFLQLVAYGQNAVVYLHSGDSVATNLLGTSSIRLMITDDSHLFSTIAAVRFAEGSQVSAQYLRKTHC